MWDLRSPVPFILVCCSYLLYSQIPPEASCSQRTLEVRLPGGEEVKDLEAA